MITSPTPAIGSTAGRSSAALAPSTMRPIARKRSPSRMSRVIARYRSSKMCRRIDAFGKQHHVRQREQRHPRQRRRQPGIVASSPSADLAEHVDARTGDRGRRLGREIKDHARDVLGRHVRFRARQPGAQHRRVDGAGADGIDAMPSSRSSAASDRVRPTTPCLAAQYADSSAVPCRPEIEATLMIRPPRRARIARRNARVTRNVPFRFESTTASQVSTGISSRRRARDDARVVDQHVGRTEPAEHVVGEARHVVGAPDVAAKQVAARVRVARATRHARARARQRRRDGAPDAARRAGDDRGLARQASLRPASQLRGLEQPRLQIGALAHLAHERAGHDA